MCWHTILPLVTVSQCLEGRTPTGFENLEMCSLSQTKKLSSTLYTVLNFYNKLLSNSIEWEEHAILFLKFNLHCRYVLTWRSQRPLVKKLLWSTLIIWFLKLLISSLVINEWSIFLNVIFHAPRGRFQLESKTNFDHWVTL